MSLKRKAEEQVSSNHESAFAIAAIAVGLWAEFTEVGELLMSHLQELCPYVIPYYQPRLPGQSSADYHRYIFFGMDIKNRNFLKIFNVEKTKLRKV